MVQGMDARSGAAKGLNMFRALGWSTTRFQRGKRFRGCPSRRATELGARLKRTALALARFACDACFFKCERSAGKAVRSADGIVPVALLVCPACFLWAGRFTATDARLGALALCAALFVWEGCGSVARWSAGAAGAMKALQAADITSLWDARHWNTRSRSGMACWQNLNASCMHACRPSSVSASATEVPLKATAITSTSRCFIGVSPAAKNVP
jgi:hypothetical protein